MWVSLLQKAYAKLLTSYLNCQSGSFEDVALSFNAIPGNLCELDKSNTSYQLNEVDDKKYNITFEDIDFWNKQK